MPHERDMTHWDEIRCQRGCDNHPTRTVQIHLGGPTKYRDLTSIPERFAMDFEIEVWDTAQTPVDGGPYCPARDAVSETIISHGVWEPRETTVLLLAWEALGWDCEFVDIGAQIGWFTWLANHKGIDAYAVEADPAVASVLEQNIHPGLTEIINLRMGADIPDWFPGPISHPYVVAKIDIEGAEEAAVVALSERVGLQRVPFILMEVSPVFNDSYPDLVADLMSRGYSAYLMPPKAAPPIQINSLASLVPYEICPGAYRPLKGDGTPAFRSSVDLDAVREVVAGWHQEDLLLVRGGVEAWT